MVYSQISAFLVENKLITDKNLIREMWADHFETLGITSVNENFDSNFLTCVTAGVAEIFKSCTDDLSGALCAPLEYEEVTRVCSRLKPEVLMQMCYCYSLSSIIPRVG